MRRALLAIAANGEAEEAGTGIYGQEFLIRDMLHGTMDRAALFVTIWIIRRGERIPRFVTAYPEP